MNTAYGIARPPPAGAGRIKRNTYKENSMMHYTNQSHRKLLSVLLTLSMLLGLLPTMAWAALDDKPADSNDPTAKTGLVYNGSAQVLVNNGTIVKSGDNGAYRYYVSSTSGEPGEDEYVYDTIGGSNVTRKNAGTYYVYWIWDNNSDRNGSKGKGNFTVTIDKKPSSISFSQSSITKCFGLDGSFAQTVSNTGDGTVSYSSGNTSVATVNSSTGAVTLQGAGTATITATVADTANYTYANKTVSYTLNVWTYRLLSVDTGATLYDLGDTPTTDGWIVKALYAAPGTTVPEPDGDGNTTYPADQWREQVLTYSETADATHYSVALSAISNENKGKYTVGYKHNGTDETADAEVGIKQYTLTANSVPDYGDITFKIGDDVVNAAPYGQDVTVTVTPDTGYTPGTVTATDTTNNEPVTVNGGTSPYSFTMPKGNVTVTVPYSETKYGVTVNGDENTAASPAPAASVTTAAAGEVVTITASAVTGYAVEGIEVKDGENQLVPSTGMSFIMPEKAVTVTVKTAAVPTATVWHNLNEKQNNEYVYGNGATLYTGRYYLTANRTFDGSSTGNGLKIANGATVYIYLNGHTLSATGKAASGMTGGYAGIYLPSSATLYFVGDGTVKADGGAAAAGGSGSNGSNGSISAYAGGGALGFGGSTSASATAGRGGAGGYGGGGAGAGIGTNGGSGLAASTSTTKNSGSANDRRTPAAAGTVNFLGSVTITGSGGSNGAASNGSNGTGGTVTGGDIINPPNGTTSGNARKKDSAKKLFKTLKASASASGGAGGSGGQAGGAGAVIGTGGYGGGGGAKGVNGNRAASSSYSAYNSPVSRVTNDQVYTAKATDGIESTATTETGKKYQYNLVGINADLTTTENNLFAVNTTLDEVLAKLNVEAYYSKGTDTDMASYNANSNWAAIDIKIPATATDPGVYVTDGTSAATADSAYIGVWLQKNPVPSANADKIVAGGNNILVTFDAGNSTGFKTVELNVAGGQNNTDFAGGDANKFKTFHTVKHDTYDGLTHTLPSLFDFADSWNRTYAVLYTPYNDFVDYSAQGKDTAKYAEFRMDDPTTTAVDESKANADNWLLGGDTIKTTTADFFVTAGTYFDASAASGNYKTATAYKNYLGNYADFNNVQVKDAGLYTVYERVLNWDYNATGPYTGTYTSSYTYNTYYIVIEKADLKISNAIDTVTENTTVQNHTFDRTVVGENNEDVLGEYTFASNDAQSTVYSYCKGETWESANAQNKSANANTPDITNLSWEFNVKHTYNAGNTWDKYSDYVDENPDGNRNQNNYLCQNDGTMLSVDKTIGTAKYTAGKTEIDGTTLKADKNTWYSGSNGELHYASSAVGGIALLDASDSLNITARYEKDQKIVADGTAADNAKTAWGDDAQEYRDGTTDHAYVAANETVTSVFAEDVAFGANLFKASYGFRVSDGDAVSGDLAGGTPITGSASLGTTKVVDQAGTVGADVATIEGNDLLAKLVDTTAKTYKGDYYVVSVKDKDGKLVKAWDYNDTDDNCNILTNVPVGSEYELVNTNKWDAFKAGTYTVTVEYVGLYYQNNIDNAGRAAGWNGTESFNWVTASKSFTLVIEPRNIAYKPMADLYKVYDNSKLLVKDTLNAGDVTKASAYIIDLYHTPASVNQFVKGLSNTVNGGHSSYNDCMWNYLQPANYGSSYNTALKLELAGTYASGLANGAEDVTISASRLKATTNKDEDNYKLIKVSNQALTGEVFTAQMYPTHNMTAVVRVHETTPMFNVLGVSVQAYMPVVTNSETGVTSRTDMAYDATMVETVPGPNFGFFASDVDFAKIELINKDNLKGENGVYAADTQLTVGDTTNYAQAYDYDADYELILNMRSHTFIVHDAETGYPDQVVDGLAIDEDTGAITHVAELTSNNNNVNNFLSATMKLDEFGNFVVIHQAEDTAQYPSATYGECAESGTKNGGRDTTVYSSYYAVKTGVETNASAHSDNTLTHIVRYYIGGNGDTFNLLLPIDQLNKRNQKSAFDNKTGSEQDIVIDSGLVTQETYQYVTLYENGDSAKFSFALPQDSYLTDLLIVAIPADAESGKTPTSDSSLMPKFADIDLGTDEANLVGKFSAANSTDGKISSTFCGQNCNLFLKLEDVKNDAGTSIKGTDFNSGTAETNFYGNYKLADANYQTGGSTYVFSLTTGESNLGTEYNIVIVPVYKAYDALIEKDDNDPATTEYAPNLTVEQTITGAADSTLKAGDNDSVYVNYKTLWDTTAVNGTQGTITLSYGTTPTSKTWNLAANAKDAFNSLAIATEADASTIAFFDPAKLLPGTAVTVTISLWRNGVVADPQTADDKDAFDTVTFTWTVTQEEYEKLFGDDVVTLRDSSGVLGYSTVAFTNFAGIATFVTNHASSASTADTAWSVQTGFDALTKYYAEWYTDAGFTAANKVADTSNVTSALGGTFYGKAASSYGGGGGGAAPAPAITVPVSGESGSVAVSATLSGSTATMKEPTSAELDKVIGQSVETGEVTIDMSGLSSSVATAAIPTATVKAIEAAVASETNDADELTVKLPDGSVTFDAAALATIADQAKGSDLKLMVDNVAASTLSAAQRDAVKDVDTQAVYSITLVSGTTTISDFKGGSATVSVPYTLKAGQSARGIVVWYVANDGEMTEVPATFAAGKVTFTVAHFSNYVVAYDAERAASCPQDSTCPISAFADADATAWYHDGVHWAIENGVMNGVGNGLFDPNGTVTRGMVMTMLARMEGVDTTADEGQTWYDKGVAWAMEKGVSDGTNPTAAVTREQFATMLYRYAKLNGQGFTDAWMFLLDYPDAADISEWADEAMHWMVMQGVINGMDGKLNPQGDASRVQIATMLMRYTESVAK